jgi:murein DD-endopeptidase MepM/ murein hydrolase activator NlpD
MKKTKGFLLTRYIKIGVIEFSGFLNYFFSYCKKKVITFSFHFERNKNRLVKFFMMKRGRYNRPFLHLTTMGVLGVGVLVAPFLADTFPIFSSNASALDDLTQAEAEKQSILVGHDVFQTNISQKPRDKVITYTVQKGDTISIISKRFNISEDTIRWANDLLNDDITVGDELQILPVTGIAHKVSPGETVYTIAKKYDTNPQAIVDFPFNDFANPETFALVDGQILIVPEGVKPSEQPTYRNIRQETYIAKGNLPVGSGGWVFPVSGMISQYPAWYHMAVDVAGATGDPILAAHGGTVIAVNVGVWDGGYGNNIWIDRGDGIKTHYAHLNGVNVSAGQRVNAGTVIGWRGNTGRSTGPHLHFEVQVNGVLVNPLGYVHP